MSAIDYAEIDRGVRPIVRRLNEMGARTIFSCEGHAPLWNGYVLFRASQGVLKRVLTSADMDWVAGEVDCYEGQLRYALRWRCPDGETCAAVRARLARALAAGKPLRRVRHFTVRPC